MKISSYVVKETKSGVSLIFVGIEKRIDSELMPVLKKIVKR
jgi:hypothetical protein